MDNLRDFAGRLDEAAATCTGIAGDVGALAPAEHAFGVNAPGRLGELGRALNAQWVATTEARLREAVAAADLLIETAAALRVAAASYTDTDETVGRRQAEER